jgi:hypothetical protein
MGAFRPLSGSLRSIKSRQIADSERKANSLDCCGRVCRLIILVRLLLFLHPAAGEQGPAKRNASPTKIQAVSVRRSERTSPCCPHAARATGGTRYWRWNRPHCLPGARSRGWEAAKRSASSCLIDGDYPAWSIHEGNRCSWLGQSGAGGAHGWWSCLRPVLRRAGSCPRGSSRPILF